MQIGMRKGVVVEAYLNAENLRGLALLDFGKDPTGFIEIDR